MLEFYTKQLEELASQTAQLIQNIRTTQDIIKINLDSQRNSVLIMEAKVVMASLGVTSGTLVAGFFGIQSDRIDARPFDDVADAPADAGGNAQSGVPLVREGAGRRRFDGRADHRGRRDHAGSQRRDAFDQAARRWPRL